MNAIAWMVTDGDWRRVYTSEDAADALVEGAERAGCRPLFKVPLFAEVEEPRYRLTPKGLATLGRGHDAME